MPAYAVKVTARILHEKPGGKKSLTVKYFSCGRKVLAHADFGKKDYTTAGTK
jgi:hypothetical protein